jgi:N-acetylglucosaminyldiphosphoundecaprenol N-acetyl-beta-D-mannosaminyltransferase
MERIEQACSTRQPLRIATVNVGFLTLARRNPRFASILATTGLSVVDGRLLQWLTWLAGRPAPEQITGHDLFRCAIKLAHSRNYSLFLLGGQPGVASELAQQLRSRHAGLRVEGTHHGLFSLDGHAEDETALLAQIRIARPDMLFVALGAPKQDLWLANHLESLNVPVGIGVGCVFDVETGRIPRAPRWAQAAGLESVFQLIVAPRRYLKRYLIDDIPTLVRGFVSALRVRFHGVAP